jgi:hypothetical protein
MHHRYADAKRHSVAIRERVLGRRALMVCMRPAPETTRRAADVARLAARRHGIITREELLALGYSNAAIDRLVKPAGSIASTAGCMPSGTRRSL